MLAVIESYRSADSKTTEGKAAVHLCLVTALARYKTLCLRSLNWMPNYTLLNILKRFLKFLFIYLLCTYTCIGVWRSENKLWESVPSTNLPPAFKQLYINHALPRVSHCLLVQLVYLHVFRSDEINEAKMNFHLFGFRKKSHGETRILAIRDVTQLEVYLIA